MPERMGQWTLLGHGSDPVVADTAAVSDRVAHYRDLAEQMQTNAVRLDRIGDGSALQGKYADELRSSSRDVAKDLHQVVGRYQAVASALEAYEPELESALAESLAALDDAVAANGAGQAADGMPTATAEEGKTLTADQTAQNDAKTAATNRAADALSAAKGRLDRALDGLDGAGRAASATINGGFHDGLKDSGWDRFVYAFMKFLKILVKVLTYLAMALAVIALVIPGLGPILFAAAMAISVVDVAANAALVAGGEGSWADFGIALAGLLTFGVGKLFGPAIQAGLKSIGNGVKSSVNGALDTARGLRGARGARGADDDAIPLLERPPVDGPPAAWNVPGGATRAPHPDLGDANNAFRTGDSWQDANGTVFTRLDDFRGFRGLDDAGRDAHAAGTRFQDGLRNGHDDPDWKGLYATDNVGDARGYAEEGLHELRGGHVMTYSHGGGVTVVSPAEGIGEAAAGRALFGYAEDGTPFMEQLGRDGYILRNPIEDGVEYIVPWSRVNPAPLGEYGSFGAHPNPFKAPWIEVPRVEAAVPVASGSTAVDVGAGALRHRTGAEVVPA